MKQLYTAVSYEEYYNYYIVYLARKDGDFYAMEVFVDKKYKDVITDWNQYIFTNEEARRQTIQSKAEEFEEASSEAINYLEQAGEIRQKKNGAWVKCNKLYKFFKKLFTNRNK